MTKSIFVCPVCKGSLVQTDQGFHCAACVRDYPILEGIPDFYISGAELTTDGAESQAWRDNLVWLDPQMADARDIIYRLSVRELKGMTFAMQQLALRTFPGCRILEVGTGTGHFTRWMAEVSAPGTEIYSVDFSWPMFAKARANIADQPGVNLLRANAMGKLPFRDGSFDLVFLRLAPLGEPGTWNVQVAFQLLKPGGWLFKAGWDLVQDVPPWSVSAIRLGFECAEVHEWLYSRLKTQEEEAAHLVEQALADAYDVHPGKGLAPCAGYDRIDSNTWEHLKIARRPLR